MRSDIRVPVSSQQSRQKLLEINETGFKAHSKSLDAFILAKKKGGGQISSQQSVIEDLVPDWRDGNLRDF